MDRLNAMRVFIKVAEIGSFTAAAGVLGTTPQNVAKLIASLEKTLHAKLIQRNTRVQTLTEIGRIYYERAVSICRDIDDTDALLSTYQTEVSGKLKVFTGNTFGIYALAQKLPAWLKANPAVSLDITVANRRVDLIKEGFDAAVVDELPEDGSVVFRTICDFPIVLAASPDYVREHGNPASIADLDRHTIIRRPDQVEWAFIAPDKRYVTYRPNDRYLVSNCQVACEMALSGLGITKQPLYRLRSFIESGSLVPVFETHTVPPKKLSVIYPARRLMSLKLRRFIDFLFEEFSDGKL